MSYIYKWRSSSNIRKPSRNCTCPIKAYSSSQRRSPRSYFDLFCAILSSFVFIFSSLFVFLFPLKDWLCATPLRSTDFDGIRGSEVCPPWALHCGRLDSLAFQHLIIHTLARTVRIPQVHCRKQCYARHTLSLWWNQHFLTFSSVRFCLLVNE